MKLSDTERTVGSLVLVGGNVCFIIFMIITFYHKICKKSTLTPVDLATGQGQLPLSAHQAPLSYRVPV